MEHRGAERRRSGRASPALPVLALLGAVSGCGREPSLPEFGPGDLIVRLGTAGAIEPKRWNVLRARVQNRGGDFEGHLEVRGLIGEDRDGIVHRMPIEVPGKGAAREISLAVRPDGWTGFRVALEGNGWRQTWEEPILLESEVAGRILAVENRVSDWSALVAELPLSPCAVSRLAPADMPAEALAYDPFALVILNGVTLAGSPPGTVAALRRWVERGGTLLAFPGPDWAAGIPAETLDLLGVRAGDPAALPDPALAGRVGPQAYRAMAYRALEPAPGTQSLLGGLAFLSRRGCGLTQCFAFGPGAAFPSRADGGWAFHDALAEPLDRLGSFEGHPQVALKDLEGRLETAFHWLAGITIPSAGAVGIAMAIYILLGIAIPGRIFARLGRREWTYPVLLAASALAVILIARYGLLNSAQSSELNEISILRAHSDGGRAEATTYVSAISPRRRSFAFETVPGKNPAEVLGQPLRGELMEARVIFETSIDSSGGGAVLAPLTLYPNALRAFRFDYGTGLEGLARFQQMEQDGEPVGYFTNESAQNMSLYLVAGERCFDLGDLGPGKGRTIDPARVGAERLATALLQTGGSGGPGSMAWNLNPLRHGAKAGDLVFEAMLHLMKNQEEGGASSPPAPTTGSASKSAGSPPRFLVARSSRPVLPLNAAGLRRIAHTFILFELKGPRSG